MVSLNLYTYMARFIGKSRDLLSRKYRILNTISVLPVAAYSTRLLNMNYTGKCMNVRRSSDSTTKDIGFVGSNIDTASLLSFVGSGTGYVVTWYDQSGNGYNATQATTTYQPIIVTSGVVGLMSNRPTIFFNNTSTHSFLSSTSYNAFSEGPITISCITNTTTANWSILLSNGLTTSGNCYVGLYNSSPSYYFLAEGGVTGVSYSISLTLSTPYITTFTSAGIISNSITGTAYINGTSAGTQTQSQPTTQGTGFTIGASNTTSSDGLDGNISEMIIYSTQLSAYDRQTLEHNQELYYGISGI